MPERGGEGSKGSYKRPRLPRKPGRRMRHHHLMALTYASLRPGIYHQLRVAAVNHVGQVQPRTLGPGTSPRSPRWIMTIRRIIWMGIEVARRTGGKFEP